MKVLITRQLLPATQKHIKELKLKHSNVEIIQYEKDEVMPRQELLEAVTNVDCLLCLITDRIDEELLSKAPILKLISTMSVGYDHIDLEACKQKNIKVTNTPHVLTDATADLTLALYLCLSRRLMEAHESVLKGEWGNWSPSWLCGSQLKGKTVGIFGMGRIGRELANRLFPFKPKEVLYHNRSQLSHEILNPLISISSIYHTELKSVSFDELIERSDVLFITCSLNENTRQIFNMEVFQKMKSNCLLINTARGHIIHFSDLERALDQKLIAGVALDVTDPEPLPKDSELLKRNNVVILPHIGSATLETREQMGNLALKHVEQFIKNEPLSHPVL